MALGAVAQSLRGLPVAALAAALFAAYLIGLAVYRLCLSPLARFPGPKLAALSKWYEMYYEVAKKGQFTFRIQEMHKKYGPIVRITPYELHIADSDFWDVLYSKNPKSDKYDWMNGRFQNDGSIFTTSDQAMHRLRRSALNPMFSKRSVGQLEPFVRAKLDAICSRVADYMRTGQVLAINRIWNAFSGDVITQYAFGFNYEHTEAEDFKESFHDAFMAVSEFGHVVLQFPWIPPVLNALPDEWVRKMKPALAKILQLQRDLRQIIFRISQEVEQGEEKPSDRTIFHEILKSDLPPAEKANRRLAEEAQTIIGAGITTTAWALTNSCYYILADQRVQDTLRAELRAAIPDPFAPDAFSFTKLEGLPYLRGCIREGIRLSHAVTSRNPRVFTYPLNYRDWVIPPGTPTSMCISDVQFDEEIFPNPDEFVPERWMGDPKAPDGHALTHYFVAFGTGPRQCLGMNLAWMEQFMGLAFIFRRFEFALHETDVTDVLLAHDFFLPSPKLDTKGVRVKVKGADY